MRRRWLPAPLAWTSRASTRSSSACGLLAALRRCCDAFRHAEAQAALHQRRHPLEHQVVKLGPGLPSDLDGVLKACGGDERHTRALALQQGVGADGGAVQKDDRSTRPVRATRFGDGLRGIFRRGENFQVMRRRPRSIQTQSVKVPPVSTAIQSGGGGWFGGLGGHGREQCTSLQGLGQSVIRRRFRHCLQPLPQQKRIEPMRRVIIGQRAQNLVAKLADTAAAQAHCSPPSRGIPRCNARRSQALFAGVHQAASRGQSGAPWARRQA